MSHIENAGKNITALEIMIGIMKARMIELKRGLVLCNGIKAMTIIEIIANIEIAQ